MPLAPGQRTVSDELAEPLPMSLAAISKHIRVLEQSGLIQRSVQRRTHVSRLNAKPLADAQKWLSFYGTFWNERFDALEDLCFNKLERTFGARTQLITKTKMIGGNAECPLPRKIALPHSRVGSRRGSSLTPS
nr:transcriptional regulator [Hyphomicrobium sp.]